MKMKSGYVLLLAMFFFELGHYIIYVYIIHSVSVWNDLNAFDIIYTYIYYTLYTIIHSPKQLCRLVSVSSRQPIEFDFCFKIMFSSKKRVCIISFLYFQTYTHAYRRPTRYIYNTCLLD